MRRRMVFWSFLLLFVGLFFYFLLMIQREFYVGIQLHSNQKGTWQVERILKGGAAAQSTLQVGDTLIAVDGKPLMKNQVVKRWHIIEQAKSVTIGTETGPKQIKLTKGAIGEKDYVEISLICFFVVLCYSATFYRYLEEKNGFQIGLFMIFSSMTAVAVIPSSMGFMSGRFLVISYVSLFPLLLFRCFFQSATKLRLTRRIEQSNLGITVLTLLVFFSLFSLEVGPLIGWFLQQGIFYLMLLELSVYGALFFYSSPKSRSERMIGKNIFLGMVFAYLPFYVFYFFSSKWTLAYTEVFMAILCSQFIFYHYAAISHMLFSRRAVASYFLRINYFFLGGLFLYLITKFSVYFPAWLVICSFLLWARLLFPVLFEAYFMVNRETVTVVDRIQLFQAAERERERVAILIHDTVLQETLLLKRKLEETKPPETAETILKLETIAYNMRDMCQTLYPLILSGQTFQESLEQLIRQFQTDYLIDIAVYCPEELVLFNDIHVFMIRIVQECLTNSIKHGQAQEATVKVSKIDEQICLSIWDNGDYQMPRASGQRSYGLTHIQEKIRWLKGSVELSKHLDGTEVRIQFPEFKEDGR